MGSEVKIDGKALADELQAAYDRFAYCVDDGSNSRADAWDDFADLCEVRLPLICSALSTTTKGGGDA